jgi:2-phosphosulfolactate phosphatase
MPRMTDFNYYSLEDADKATGFVVVVDVLRAFTTAAHAFNVGVEKILPVSGVEEAVQLRKRIPGSLIMGEVDGIKPVGFNFGNSPAAFCSIDLSGRTLIQRTSAGTQGIVRAVNANHLFAASFVVAKATAGEILCQKPAEVSFVITGESAARDGDEDRACAEYIQALVINELTDKSEYIERVGRSSAGRSFLDVRNKNILMNDFIMSIQADIFHFTLPVKREDSLWIMTNKWS